MTQHAVVRAMERGVKLREILEGRAHVQQILDNDMRFITVIPIPPKKVPPTCGAYVTLRDGMQSCIQVG